MVKVRMKGVHKVTRKLADGSKRKHYLVSGGAVEKIESRKK